MSLLDNSVKLLDISVAHGLASMGEASHAAILLEPHIEEVKKLRLCRLSKEMFVRAGAPASTALCSEESPWSNRLLGPSCPLFARKFSNNTADAVRSLPPLSLSPCNAWTLAWPLHGRGHVCLGD